MPKTAFFMQLLYGGRYMTKYVYLFNEGNGKMKRFKNIYQGVKSY